MVRRLEDEDFAVVALESRNAQAQFGFAEETVAKLVG
jgi:hypothetical protein